MKINTININFGTTHRYNKKEKNPNIGGSSETLNHSTQFFRYNENDEFIVNELKKRPQNKSLNIVSAGCSFGEEVYSFALALDDLPCKPKICGIDVSQKAIYGAKRGTYFLDDIERSYLEEGCSLRTYREKTPYREELKRRFNKNFKVVNSKFHEYKLEKGALCNCVFACENILALDSIFDENSQDLILCRMVLYHLSEKDSKIFFEKAYKILKPGGMLCIEPYGHYDYHKDLTSIGFEHPFNDALFIYTKPKEKNKFANYLKQMILNNKSDFNNV